ncbi:unnamed protein product [Oreochromis niloticus]|nr:unnamed protein product [Mustela putorius furo]
MSTERKELAWNIRRRLFSLQGQDLFELAKSLASENKDTTQLSQDDKEGCMDYITSYIQSNTLLQLEDEGMSHLLTLNDLINLVIQGGNPAMQTAGENEVHAMPSPQPSNTLVDPQPPEDPPDITPNPYANTETQQLEELRKAYETLGERLRLCGTVRALSPAVASQQSSSQPQPIIQVSPKQPVTVRDLSYLPRREFKVFGGQIGDNSSEISYNSLTKQINEGVKEGFVEAEIVRGVLRIVKPGTFRDMLMLKDDLSLHELQGFLRSHLGEKATTEMLQELMCARQSEQETPQQFLYRMIGLKQKLIFQSKQANTEISYDPRTVQEVFLHTIYQGLGAKYADLRQRLRPLTSNNNVTDEEILSEVTKIISDENEHKRRLGQVTRQKSAQAQSAGIEANDKVAKEQSSPTIKQLAAQVETLTNMVASLIKQQEAKPCQLSPQPPSNPLFQTPANPNRPPQKKAFLCPKCTEQNLQDCSHCFVCCDSGHRAVGCLKRTKTQGNWNRSLPRDSQRPAQSHSPSQ